jgi:hypothetical protein
MGASHSMKKRLTEPQFHEATKGLGVGSQTLETARGVLIDGKPQKEFAASLGLSTGCDFAGRQARVGGARRNQSAGGVRASLGDPAGTPRIHRQEVG